MSLVDDARGLVDLAVAAYEGTPHVDALRAARTRLDEPLRVAVAGKMKAGKSTLLNALVGERLAPTDAGECTRIVTWYRNGHTYQVLLEAQGAAPRQVPFRRDNGAIDVDLGGLEAAAVERLVVDWPSENLQSLTLIDTPGIDSLSEDVSARTTAFLTPEDDRATPADAVLYLVRHLHESDVRFLEGFHDDAVAQATPINAIGVLSRADEIGGGRLDAMESAARIAARYRGEPAVRRLCQTVIPIAGLLAESASTLRQEEFQALATLAGASGAEVDRLLRSADRFARSEVGGGLPAEQRRALVLRFGLFGVRLAVSLIRGGSAQTAGDLATALVATSGLDQLRSELGSLFETRAGALKARSALAAVDAALKAAPPSDAVSLWRELERIESGAHEFAELRVLSALRSGALQLPGDDGFRAERLLGAEGATPAVRLGLPGDAPDDDVRDALTAALGHWQQQSASPLLSRPAAEAVRVLVRTCEGMFAELSGT
ncbi:MAG: dynamin family protein [Actinobacteria bacterium]|nr:dynamin family protein [Actinomycetota bacterium]